MPVVSLVADTSHGGILPPAITLAVNSVPTSIPPYLHHHCRAGGRNSLSQRICALKAPRSRNKDIGDRIHCAYTRYAHYTTAPPRRCHTTPAHPISCPAAARDCYGQNNGGQEEHLRAGAIYKKGRLGANKQGRAGINRRKKAHALNASTSGRIPGSTIAL